jgi:hypothetical protein
MKLVHRFFASQRDMNCTEPESTMIPTPDTYISIPVSLPADSERLSTLQKVETKMLVESNNEVYDCHSLDSYPRESLLALNVTCSDSCIEQLPSEIF